MLISEIMDEGGEDRISNLPDSVISHVLSRLPTKDAMRTSILSKDWEYKWTSIFNIQLDDGGTSLRGKIRNKAFVSFVERVLHLTQNSRIKSFCLSCSTKLDTQYLKTRIAGILMRGVQNLEIKTYGSKGNTFGEELYNCRSLTELKLVSYCTLSTSFMKNCFPNLKILHLANGVHLSSDEISNTGKVLLNFPVLEELELRYCAWSGAKSVEINAPALIRLVVEGDNGGLSNDYMIKIDAPKLEKFKSSGLLDNYVVAAPTISNAVVTHWGRDTTLGLRAHTILKGFPVLKYLKLSDGIVKALIESNVDFSLPCFNQQKQLEFISYLYGDELLTKLLQVMPSLESLSLEEGVVGLLNFFPSGIASRLKVVELVGFRATKSQIQFAESVLKNADNLETLFVFVSRKPLMPKIEIKTLLSAFGKSSSRATVVVNGSRKRRRLNE